MLNANKLKMIAKLGFMVFMLLLVVVPSICSAQLDLGLEEVGEATQLGQRDVRTTIGSIINVALGFLGVVAVVIVLVGGFKYMIAGGSEEKVGDAKKWIISGIIGLAIILSAYAITTFVVDNLISATSEDAPAT